MTKGGQRNKKRTRTFAGREFHKDNFLYREDKIDFEVRKARQQGFLVRKIREVPYKSGTGHWWALYYYDKRRDDMDVLTKRNIAGEGANNAENL